MKFFFCSLSLLLCFPVFAAQHEGFDSSPQARRRSSSSWQGEEQSLSSSDQTDSYGYGRYNSSEVNSFVGLVAGPYYPRLFNLDERPRVAFSRDFHGHLSLERSSSYPSHILLDFREGNPTQGSEDSIPLIAVSVSEEQRQEEVSQPSSTAVETESQRQNMEFLSHSENLSAEGFSSSAPAAESQSQREQLEHHAMQPSFSSILARSPISNFDLTTRFDAVVSVVIGDARLTPNYLEDVHQKDRFIPACLRLVFESYNPGTKEVQVDVYEVNKGAHVGNLLYFKHLWDFSSVKEEGYELVVESVPQTLEWIADPKLTYRMSWLTRVFYVQETKKIFNQKTIPEIWYVNSPIRHDITGVDFRTLEGIIIPKKSRPVYHTGASYVSRLLETQFYIDGFNVFPFSSDPTLDNLMTVFPMTRSTLEKNVYTDRVGNVNLGTVAASLYGVYRWAHDKRYGEK